MAESSGARPPLHNHDPEFQRGIIRDGTREEIINWLCWNDPNGCYSDEDSRAEGYPLLSLEQAKQIMTEQIGRDSV